MNFVYAKIKEIEKQPCLFLKENSLLLLKTFLDGYIMREADTNIKIDESFMCGFQEFVASHYNEKSAFSWCQIISDHCSPSEQPIEAFFALIEKYIRENPRYMNA